MRSLTVVCILACVFLLSAAPVVAGLPDDPEVSGPFITIRPRSLDFGIVTTGQERQEVVTVLNMTREPILLTRISISNSRFRTSPSGNLTLPASDSIHIVVTFAPLDTGIIYGWLSVNDLDFIQVSGVGMGQQLGPRFYASPPSLILEPRSTADSTRSDTVLVSNGGLSPLAISNAFVNSKLASVTPSSAVIAPGESTPFVLHFTPLKPGFYAFDVSFSHNGNSLHDVVPVRSNVTGDTIAPLFRTSTRLLDFDTVRTGTTVTDSVVVYNIGEREMNITQVQTHDTYMVNWVQGPLPAGGSRILRVSLTAKSPRQYQDMLLITHNGWNGLTGTDTVRLRAIAVGETFAGRCSVSRNIIDFGTVILGHAKRDTVVIRNIGNDDLRFASWGITPTQPQVFIEAFDSRPLPPGEQCVVTLDFNPVKTGSWQAAFYVRPWAAYKTDTVFLRGFCDTGNPDPVLHFSSMGFNAGWVGVDTVWTKDVIITNVGRSRLAISRVASSHPWLTVSPDTAFIEPSRSAAFTLRFLPTDSGIVDASVKFSSNATTPEHAVTFTARAIHFVRLSALREAPPGALFAFEGVVSRCKGRYTRLQDSTAGITMYHPSGLLFNDVARASVKQGTKLRVYAHVTKKRYLTLVDEGALAGYEIRSRGYYFQLPRQLRTLADIAARGEDYESEYVSIPNLQIQTNENVFRARTTYDIIDATDQTKRVKLALSDSLDSEYAGAWIRTLSVDEFNGVVSQDSDDPNTGYVLLPITSGDLLDEGDGIESAPSTALLETYPHPLRQSATISYALAEAGHVHLRVVDALGREVRTLVSGDGEAGVHRTVWSGVDENGRRLAAGVYFLDLRVTDFSARLLHHSVRPLLLQR